MAKEERKGLSKEAVAKLQSMPLIDLLHYCKSIGISQNFERRKHAMQFLQDLPPLPQFEVRLSHQVEVFRQVGTQQLAAIQQLRSISQAIPKQEQTTHFSTEFQGIRANSLDVIETTLKDPNANLIVVGDVSSGKSLFLNTFLFHEKVLPSASGKCSPAICKVQYGEKALLMEHADGKVEQLVSLKTMSSTEIHEYLAQPGIMNPVSGMSYILRWDNELLQTGLNFVDTPGFNDNELKTTEVINFMKNATGFVVMIHAEIGVSATLVNFFRELFKDPEFSVASVFFIVTHLDLEDTDAARDNALSKIFKDLEVALPGWLTQNFCPVNLKAASKGSFSGLYMPVDYRNLLVKLSDFLDGTMTYKSGIMQNRIQNKLNLLSSLILTNLNAATTDATTKAKRRSEIQLLQESFEANKGEITRLGEVVMKRELNRLSALLTEKITSFMNDPRTKVEMQKILQNFQITFTGNEKAEHYFLQYLGQLNKHLESFVELELRTLQTGLIMNIARAMHDEWQKAEDYLIGAKHCLTEPGQGSTLMGNHKVRGRLIQPARVVGSGLAGLGSGAMFGVGVVAAIFTGGWGGLGVWALCYFGGGAVSFGAGLSVEMILQLLGVNWEAKNIYENIPARLKFINIILQYFQEQTQDVESLVNAYLKPIASFGNHFLTTALNHLESTFVEVDQLSTLSTQITVNQMTAERYQKLSKDLSGVDSSLRRLELYSNSKWNIKPRRLTYNVQSPLGHGKSSVFCGELEDEQKIPVAVKVMQMGSKLLQEAEVLCSLSHTNIVKFYGICYTDKMHLVYERCSLTLREFLTRGPSEHLKKCLALDIANGMLYLQSRTVVHRDLTSFNILLCGSGDHMVAKIADFGEAKTEVETNNTPNITTPVYAAPDEGYACSYDIYSFGLILWQMWHIQDLEEAWLALLNKSEKFHQHTLTIQGLNKMQKQGLLPDIHPSVPDNIKNLIRACCDLQPSKRPKWETVLLALTKPEWRLDQPIPERKKTRPLRILSMDGGGTAAVILLTVLSHLLELASRQLGQELEVHQLFDMIGGTSTGGIVSLGLGGHRMSVKEGLALYLEGSPKIFPASVPKRLARLIFLKPMFDHAPLEHLLKETFGEIKLSKLPSKPKVFTVARKDCDSGPYLFRNYESTHRLAAAGSQDAFTFQAARATAGPPIILERMLFQNHVFSDGGLGFNNPSNLAVDEAVALALQEGDAPEGSVACVLSLGCGKAECFDPTGDSIVTLTKSTLTDTEVTHRSMQIRSVQCGFHYERLNPTLPTSFHLWESDPKNLEIMIARTKEYLQSPPVQEQLNNILPFLLQPLQRVGIHIAPESKENF